MPKLILVHCGYSQSALSGGVFEGHVDFFVAADDFEEARAKVKALPEFKQHRMHVDGFIEIKTVEGYSVELKKGETEGTELISRHGFARPAKKKRA